jgi:hypothetical protein
VSAVGDTIEEAWAQLRVDVDEARPTARPRVRLLRA